MTTLLGEVKDGIAVLTLQRHRLRGWLRDLGGGAAGAGKRSGPLRKTGDPTGVPAAVRWHPAASAADRQKARAADDPHGRADRREAGGGHRLDPIDWSSTRHS